MTVVLTDGFDTYNGNSTTTGALNKWPVTFGSGGINITTPAGTRFTNKPGRSFKIVSADNQAREIFYGRALPSSLSQGAVGLAFVTNSSHSAWPAAASGGSPFLTLTTATTIQIGVGITSAGELVAFRGSGGAGSTSKTVLGTSAAGTISPAQEVFVELEFVISDTVGRMSVFVEGTQVLNLTNVDTSNIGGSVNFLNLGMAYGGANGTASHQWDDLYVRNTATRLGPRRVETIFPNSDVAKAFVPNAGTTNYTQVDEQQANGDTDYVQGSAVGDTDTYGFEDLSTTPTSVDAVQMVACAMRTDAGGRSIALQVKSGATTSDGSDIGLPTTYAKLERLLTTDPNTGSAWTGAAVNALQGGPKVTV